MLVSHRRRFVYAKTAKTAGTSVEIYFEPWCLPEGEWTFSHARAEYVGDSGIIGYRGAGAEGRRWFHHMPARAIRDGIGQQRWDSYFKFAVIRNPFDKLVSGYFFACRPEGDKGALIDGFRQWVLGGGEIMDRHTYTIDGEICLDFFIRFEALEQGLQSVCSRLSLPWEPSRLRALKTQFRQREIRLDEFYDAATAAVVEEKYAMELAHFGYGLPRP